MVTGKKLRIGLPKGNLNRTKTNRGNTRLLLKIAGYNLPHYTRDSKEAIFELKRDGIALEFHVAKPSELLRRLHVGDLELALIGKDTVEERYARLWHCREFDWDKMRALPSVPHDISNLTRAQIERLRRAGRKERKRENKSRLKTWNQVNDAMTRHRQSLIKNCVADLVDLGYGKADVCFLSTEEKVESCFGDCDVMQHDFSEAKEGVKCSSAYPNLTIKELSRYIPSNKIAINNHEDMPLFRSLQEFREAAKTNFVPDSLSLRNYNEGHRIYLVGNNTESLIKSGKVNLVVDCVSSSESKKRYNLIQLGEPILTSTVHLYQACANAKEMDSDEDEATLREDDNQAMQFRTQFCEELKKAAREYGRTRIDSIYHPSNQGGQDAKH